MAGVSTLNWGLFNPAAGGYAAALVTRITSSTTTTPVPWNGTVYDPANWQDPGSNPSRITNVSGASVLARFAFCLYSADANNASMLLNGASFRGMGSLRSETSGNDATNCVSAPIVMSASQYYEVSNPSGRTTDANEQNWASTEVLDPATKYALLYKSGTQPIPGGGVVTTLTFDSNVQDTDGWHTILQSTVTITIASPGVVTWNAHGLLANAPVIFTTTGALPTGLTAGTVYYVSATGLTANTFSVAATPGGTRINTSGTESGVHTATNNSRLTVPSGVSLVRLVGNLECAAFSGQGGVLIIKNGALFEGGPNRDTNLVAGAYFWNAVSAVIEVTPGDFFEFQVFCNNSSTASAGDHTSFSIEEVPSTIKRALCRLTVNQGLVGGVAEPLAFATAVYNPDGIWDVGAPSDFEAPSGVSEARFTLNINGPSATGTMIGYFDQNAADFYGMGRAETDTAGGDGVNAATAWVPCSPGDIFRGIALHGSSVTLAAGVTTWVCAEFR